MVRILSLDDEPEMLDLLGLILQHFGYDHLKTTNSREALTILRHEPVDLLTQDLVRPDMNGWELNRKMKSDDLLREIPILVISAKAKTLESNQSEEGLTADGYLNKPFKPVELLLTISNVLAKSSIPKPPIPTALQDLIPPMRYAACRVLLQSSRITTADPQDKQRLAALNKLQHIGEENLTTDLIQHLSDENLWVRWIAIYTLAEHHDVQAAEALIAVLTDESPKIRRAAAYALGEIRDRRAVDALIPLLQDNDTNVVTSAAQALGEIGDSRALPALGTIVEAGMQKLGSGLIVAETARRAIQSIKRAQDNQLEPENTHF